MSLVDHLESRARHHRELFAHEDLRSPLIVVVEGAGDWVERAYRPALEAAQARWPVRVYYADAPTASRRRPLWATEDALRPWETYLDKNNARERDVHSNLLPDVVFVATPSFTHVEVARTWIGRAPLIFIEKPVGESVVELNALAAAVSLQDGTSVSVVFGVDHYQLYALPVYVNRALVEAHLSAPLRSIRFSMTERQPVEARRLMSLASGLTIDMWPHLPALLALLGDLESLSELVIAEAAVYTPPIACDVSPSGEVETVTPLKPAFRRETFSRSSCRFTPVGQEQSVVVQADVGKGVERPAKYIDCLAEDGHALRVDFGVASDVDSYPAGAAMLLCTAQGECETHPSRVLPDPHGLYRTMRCVVGRDGTLAAWPIERGRYVELVGDLCTGSTTALSNVLTLDEARMVVEATQALSEAINGLEQWGSYSLAEGPWVARDEVVEYVDREHSSTVPHQPEDGFEGDFAGA